MIIYVAIYTNKSGGTLAKWLWLRVSYALNMYDSYNDLNIEKSIYIYIYIYIYKG